MLGKQLPVIFAGGTQWRDRKFPDRTDRDKSRIRVPNKSLALLLILYLLSIAFGRVISYPIQTSRDKARSTIDFSRQIDTISRTGATGLRFYRGERGSYPRDCRRMLFDAGGEIASSPGKDESIDPDAHFRSLSSLLAAAPLSRPSFRRVLSAPEFSFRCLPSYLR